MQLESFSTGSLELVEPRNGTHGSIEFRDVGLMETKTFEHWEGSMIMRMGSTKGLSFSLVQCNLSSNV